MRAQFQLCQGSKEAKYLLPEPREHEVLRDRNHLRDHETP